MNFIFKHFWIDFDFSIFFWLSFSFFIDKMFASVSDNFFNKTFITAEIIVENNIWGIWNTILYTPLSSYILCIVSSVKKNPLIEKYNPNNNYNFNDIIEEFNNGDFDFNDIINGFTNGEFDFFPEEFENQFDFDEYTNKFNEEPDTNEKF